MPGYKAPADDVRFLLKDVFHIERYANLPGFADASDDVVAAILGESSRFCEQVIAPLNRSGDGEGCRRLDDGRVTTPEGFKQAYRQFVAGGWIGLSVPTELGGQGLPLALTQGASATIAVHGSAAQKAFYLPKLLSGEWTGTMNLTEPQCGTDLGLIRTRAVARGDGTYALTGSKMFISGGEHDLTDNIVHLVLARGEGAPEGTRGLSLFIVPKYLPGADGAPGTRNAVTCGAIESKMGIHANATCLMNYDGATGWLIAEENRGLHAMFTMMNEARLVVGIQGLAQSERAYQTAVAYARERLQGRALTGAKHPGKPADPIIVHPDIRRLLMTIRAFNEAARALVMWTALRSDIARLSDDDKERQAADAHMGLLTPVIKGVLTARGFANTVMAQQVLGGHGYIQDSGLEQFVRDARVAMIYEGANGVQALDLVGRKLAKDGGRAVMAFFKEIQVYMAERTGDDLLNPYLRPLGKSLDHLQQATLWFMQNAIGKPDNAGAGSYDYMHLFGLVALGYMWCRMAETAKAKLADGAVTDERMTAKLVTARFFVERMLPESALRLERIQAGADSTMALPDHAF